MSPVGGTTRVQIFATSIYVQTHVKKGGLQRRPAGVVHAKTTGTTTTLCGHSTLSWVKFMDISFASVLDDKCPACTDAVLKLRGRGTAG